jgi:hypothetical protein
MKCNSIFAIVCIIFFVASCKKDPASSTNITLEAHKQTVTLKGTVSSTDTIHITSNTDWSVTLEPGVTWLAAEPMSGSGNGDIIFTTTENNGTAQHRTANVSVKTNSGDKSVLITIVQVQSVNEILVAGFGGNGFDSFSDFVTTPDGGYIAVGRTTSSAGDAADAKGAEDLWIVKFDNEGHKIWNKQYGGSGLDIANSIVRTPSNNYLILGGTNSVDGDVTSNHGGSDAWLISIDGDGSLLWQKAIGGSMDEALFNIRPSDDGNYIMSGWTVSDDGDVSFNHGAPDAWIVKVNDQGTVVWEKTYGGSNQDVAYDVTPVSDGGFIFCGALASNDGDADDRPVEQFAAWFVKINSAGNVAGKVYIGESGYDYGTIALEAANGDYIFAGETNTTGAFDGFHANRDAFVCRLDAAGNIIWKKAYGGSMRDEPADLIETNNGDFVFAGLTMSNDGDINNLIGGEDAWIMKLDGGGNILSNATFGGNQNDNIFQVKQLNNNSFAFVGFSQTLEDSHPDLDNAASAWFEIFSF